MKAPNSTIFFNFKNLKTYPLLSQAHECHRCMRGGKRTILGLSSLLPLWVPGNHLGLSGLQWQVHLATESPWWPSLLIQVTVGAPFSKTSSFHQERIYHCGLRVKVMWSSQPQVFTCGAGPHPLWPAFSYSQAGFRLIEALRDSSLLIYYCRGFFSHCVRL